MKALRYVGAICTGSAMMAGSIFLQWNFTSEPIDAVVFTALVVYIAGLFLGMFLFMPGKKYCETEQNECCHTTAYCTINERR